MPDGFLCNLIEKTFTKIYRVNLNLVFILFLTRQSQWAMASSFTKFLDHIQRHTTVGRTPLDEWSARRRELYLTTHNTHNRQTSMPPVGFEPTISAGERLQTYALDRAATGTGYLNSVHKAIRYITVYIWRPGDRASCQILIIKLTRCTSFSNLFLE